MDQKLNLQDIVNSSHQLSSYKKISIANQLLSSLNLNSFSNEQEEKQFDSYFLQDDVDIFMTLCNSVKLLNEPCFKRDKIVNLIILYIHEEDYLKSLLMSTCNLNEQLIENEVMSNEFLTTLVSLPDQMSNLIKLKTPHQLLKQQYFTRIVHCCSLCCQEIHKRISQEKSSSLEFISKLIGRICFNNHGEIVWKHLFSQLVNNCKNDFIWRRIAVRLTITTQKEQYIEPVVKPIVCFSQNDQNVNWLIGNSVENNAKVKFLFLNKFLLINYFDSDLVVKNIFGYLNAISYQLFIEAYKNVLNVWSNSNSLKYRSYLQHFYLSRCLMFGGQIIQKSDLNQHKDEMMKVLMKGIETHLDSSEIDIRNIGMIIGQYLLPLFVPEKEKLNFEVDFTEDIKRLVSLFNDEGEEMKADSYEETPKEENENDQQAKNDIQKVNDLDSDDDDDLVPYDMSNDAPLAQTKKPIYLRDCMDGLTDNDKPEWKQACLKAAESLILQHSVNIEEIAVEFTRIVLFLEDDGDLDFIGLRQRTMIALCISAPKLVAEYLTKQFYSPNINVRLRLDVLEVLACASQKLSDIEVSRIDELGSVIPDNSLISTNSTNLTNLTNERWKDEIERNINAKSRIISRGAQKQLKETMNKFGGLAGFFFYPLMKNYDRHDIAYDLLREDNYVLGRLLYTLGIMMKCVSFLPVSKQMGKSLIDFIWLFRYHCESFVRQAVLFCVCMILSNVPPIYLLNQMQSQLIELQQWLKGKILINFILI